MTIVPLGRDGLRPFADADPEDENRLESTARMFHALGNPDRLHLVAELRSLGDAESEASITELCLRTGLSRFAVARHLRVLVDAGFCVETHQKQTARFRLRTRGLEQVEDWVYSLLPV